ncbi:MAG: hypothetical protein M9932_11505 [Xanthobacteraceae bacterium]|nr:hypothetical protein [Xanthobacteraceae bacterium]
MAYERDPQDPFRPTRRDETPPDAPLLDNELQPDPELSEGPASPTRIALYAVVAAVILGAVFYGLNSSEPTGTPATTSTSQSTSTPKSDRGAANPNLADQSRPPVAPGVRDVTPSNNQPPNSQPGVTTGAAPAQPSPSPSSPPPASNGGKAQ